MRKLRCSEGYLPQVKPQLVPELQTQAACCGAQALPPPHFVHSRPCTLSWGHHSEVIPSALHTAPHDCVPVSVGGFLTFLSYLASFPTHWFSLSLVIYNIVSMTTF